jgi:hypothetical protein
MRVYRGAPVDRLSAGFGEAVPHQSVPEKWDSLLRVTTSLHMRMLPARIPD